MSEKKESNKGPIISAIVGAAFFAVPYVALSMPILPCLGIGAVAFGAGNLLFSEDKKIDLNNEDSFFDIINKAKKENSQIESMIPKIEDSSLRAELTELTETATKIIDTISKNPKKREKSNNFFNYYLPVTLKFVKKYDDIENQRLETKDAKEFMKSAEDMISKINKSFKTILSNLYQSDIIDTDAEMKVFDSMLKLDGFNDNNDFNIKGGK